MLHNIVSSGSIQEMKGAEILKDDNKQKKKTNIFLIEHYSNDNHTYQT